MKTEERQIDAPAWFLRKRAEYLKKNFEDTFKDRHDFNLYV